MSQHNPAPSSNAPLSDRSSHNWRQFMRVVTYAACAVIAILIVMAIGLT